MQISWRNSTETGIGCSGLMDDIIRSAFPIDLPGTHEALIAAHPTNKAAGNREAQLGDTHRPVAMQLDGQPHASLQQRLSRTRPPCSATDLPTIASHQSAAPPVGATDYGASLPQEG